MALPQVKFSEPASYGFNDILQDAHLNQQWHLRNTGQESGYTVGNDLKAFPAWDVTYGNASVIHRQLQAGVYQVRFDTNGLSSGTYFYELRTQNFRQVKKMLLVR